MGTGLNNTISMVIEVAGTGTAGAIIGFFGVSSAIMIDAVTFFLSALIITRVRCREEKVQKRMYGSELAEALGLTTATISHHMNSLIVLKMVLMEKEENKIYYQMNENGIREVLRELHDLLL